MGTDRKRIERGGLTVVKHEDNLDRINSKTGALIWEASEAFLVS